MMSFTRSLLLSLRRPVMIYLTSLSFTLITVFSAAFYLAEHETNEKVASFFESLYFTTTVMTGVGLGDIVPVTMIGRMIAMAMMLAGTAIFVAFTATLSALILDIELQHLKE